MTTAGFAVRTEGFNPPGPGDFDLPAIFDIGGLGITKPMLLIILAAGIVFAFLHATSRQSAIVPSRLQYAGEVGYDFVRNSIARDSIGSTHYMKFVPYLVSLFFFVLVNNFFGIIPFLQFPTFSHVGFVYGLAALSWVVFIGAGIWRHGVTGYIKHQLVPPGVSGPILLLIVPLEFMSNIIARPVTLALRLFANMFAGHLLLMLFTLGGQYLLLDSGNWTYAPVGIIAFVMAIAVSFLEILIMFLQAYVFTLLTAMYIGGAVNDEH